MHEARSTFCGMRAGRDSLRGADDVHRREQGDRRRSGNHGALRAPGGTLPHDARSGAGAECTARGSWARLISICPSAVIEFDPQGHMTGYRAQRAKHRAPANRGIHAAREPGGGALPRDSAVSVSLHRVHEKPDAKKVLEFEELAHAFGYSLGIEGLAEKKIQVRHGGGCPSGAMGAPTRGGREQPMFVSVPGSMEIEHSPRALSAAHRKNCRQAGGTDHFLPDAAFAEAGALRGRAAGTFCAGVSSSTRILLRRSGAIRT